jgi:Flp pilus assembly protein TadG
LALVLPLLLLVVFGITEFGRAWMTANVMYTATREGARLAVVTGPDTTLVRTRVTEVLNAAAITPKTITVSGPDADRKVTVTATTDFTIIPGKVLDVIDTTFELSASTTMRHETF